MSEVFFSFSRNFLSLMLSAISDSPYYYPDGSLRVILEARLAVRKRWDVFQPFS